MLATWFRTWMAAVLCSLMSCCQFSAALLLVSFESPCMALGWYPNSTSWGLCFVVAFGHRLCTNVARGSHCSQSSCLAEVYRRRYCSTHWFFHSVSPSVCG